MGSLIKPSAPRYTAPQPLPAFNAQSRTENETPATPVDTREKDADKVQDVIRRAARGRGSTILTSFRGVLDDRSALTPTRKNLLGE